MTQPTLFEDGGIGQGPVDPPDQAARAFAVDPQNDVVLEASAGTGKTRVLVERYVRLIEAGVDPRNILAITFTRKAAAEMRERVVAALAGRAGTTTFPLERWQALQQRAADIQISTIDAFCFGLLREFPLEADVDPAFDVADETEAGRFADEALDLAIDVARGLVTTDEHVRLLFARVKTPVLRAALANLLDRRQVAVPAVAAFVRRRGLVGTAAEVAVRFRDRVAAGLADPGVRRALFDDGPAGAAEFQALVRTTGQLLAAEAPAAAAVRHWQSQIQRYFLASGGTPRQRLSRTLTTAMFPSKAARARHAQAVAAVAPRIKHALDALEADVDALLARGLARVLAIAVTRYERLLEDHALVDFPAMLDRAVALLSRQEEFARSRLKLQARYHHLLVDEFQDTSRRQWQLIDRLVEAWAEGEGTADAPTSIFIVGDRKQSIYRFRHAEVTLLDEAAARIGALREGRPVRQAIRTSFRAVPELLAFVNALAAEMHGDATLPDRWRFDEQDRFPVAPVAPGARRDGAPVVGLIAERSQAAAAAAVAEEVARLLDGAVVRDRVGGPRPARPDDIAVLFRTRAGHQFYEEALEARGVRTYVYKGLGFFDAPEVRDVQAVVRYLAQPDSDLRAAELLRSRFVRLSDQALARLAPGVAAALVAPGEGPAGLSPADARLLARLRASLPRWLARVDRVPPGELVDAVIRETAFMFEIGGRRHDQARANLKKVRSLVRRVESRGYATMGRLAAYFDTLRSGDDSNAIVEAAGAVNLMTVHAAKGLEFPVVFVVNLHVSGRGRPPGCSVIEHGADGEPEVSFGSSEATRREDARETEELRRLLYVAVTRARDRLYLSGEVDAQGSPRRGARSLAALLPDGLAGAFAAAARSGPEVDEVVWTADRGEFALGVCRAPSGPTALVRLPAVEPTPAPEVAPLVPSGLVRQPATDGAADRTTMAEAASSRLLGTLIHRLMARRVDSSDASEADLALELLTPEERADHGDVQTLVAAALDRYRALCADPDVVAVLSAGECLYQVPVSFTPEDRPGICVRGLIDCLVLDAAGGATIVEFKTGARRPEHDVQVGLYRRALLASGAFVRVDSRIFYG